MSKDKNKNQNQPTQPEVKQEETKVVETKPVVAVDSNVVEAYGGLPPAHLSMIESVNKYVEHMAPGIARSDQELAGYHAMLYSALMSIVRADRTEDFTKAMDQLLACFRRHADGALDIIMTQRSLGFWNVDEDTRNLYTSLCAIFCKIAPVNKEKRREAARWDMVGMLEGLPNAYRDRLITYIKAILKSSLDD